MTLNLAVSPVHVRVDSGNLLMVTIYGQATPPL